MRRISALLLAFLLALTLAAPAFAVTTISVKAFVKENFERARPTSPASSTRQLTRSPASAVAMQDASAPITSVVVFTADTTTRTITLRDGSTITLAEEYGDGTTPGKSGEAPGTFHSFGNPVPQQRNLRSDWRDGWIDRRGGLRNDRTGPCREHHPDLVRRHDHRCRSGHLVMSLASDDLVVRRQNN